MADVAIRVEGLGKRYRLGERQRYKALRDTLTDGLRAPARALSSRLSRRATAGGASDQSNIFWALKDVSFDIKQGEVVGIIGRNGAGKSTLLKLLSRITEPTEGRAEIRGRVGSLLEVGTGFHPELTGRENIYLNGAVLGMSRREIERKFDEIVAFAEVEKFIDTPVKFYSSGMYLRLAFAVAAHLEPEILLVDEVLAVGDAAFQKKCLGKMGEVAKDGRTIFFVSHNMQAIRSLCSRAIMLEKGQVALDNDPAICIERYASQGEHSVTGIWEREESETRQPLTICRVSAALEGEQPYHELNVEVEMKTHSRHKPAFMAFDILDSASGTIMQAEPTVQGFITDRAVHHIARVRIKLPPLIPGRYTLSVWVGGHNTETYDWVRECVRFEIDQYPRQDRTYPYTADHGHIVPFSTVEYVRSDPA